jgi:hypothetical protein
MLPVAIEESGKAELISTVRIDGRTWHTYDIASGDVCPFVRPGISPELEKETREALEGILVEEWVDRAWLLAHHQCGNPGRTLSGGDAGVRQVVDWIRETLAKYLEELMGVRVTLQSQHERKRESCWLHFHE